MKSQSPIKKEKPAKNSRMAAEKMRNMMSKQNLNVRSKKLNKKLDFGHIHSCSYMEHTAQVKNIFWNSNINCFASYDEK